MEVFGNGARLILDYLQALAGGGETKELWEALWADRSFAAWIEAYAPWLEGFETHMRSLLQDPARVPDAEPAAFWQAFSDGFLQAMEPETNARCRRALAALMAADFGTAERAALAYLPPDTPLDAEVYLTVDGANRGMFRGQRAFLSVLKVSPEEVPTVLNRFGHEFHHIGAAHWFERSPLLAQVREKGPGGQMAAEVVEYLVAEGLANGFLSPQVLEPVEGTSEEARIQNRRVRELEARYPAQGIAQIERLLLKALSDPTPEELSALEREFETFSLDLSGAGLPEGHFVAGRMVQRMARSLPLERIVGLVQAPHLFFARYNEAVGSGEPRFSERLLERIAQTFAPQTPTSSGRSGARAA